MIISHFSSTVQWLIVCAKLEFICAHVLDTLHQATKMAAEYPIFQSGGLSCLGTLQQLVYCQQIQATEHFKQHAGSRLEGHSSINRFTSSDYHSLLQQVVPVHMMNTIFTRVTDTTNMLHSVFLCFVHRLSAKENGPFLQYCVYGTFLTSQTNIMETNITQIEIVLLKNFSC